MMYLSFVSWDKSNLEVEKHKVDPLEAVEIAFKGDLAESQRCS